MLAPFSCPHRLQLQVPRVALCSTDWWFPVRAHAHTAVVCVSAVGSMINLGVVTLLQHPDQLDALKKVSEGSCERHLAAYALPQVVEPIGLQAGSVLHTYRLLS